MPSFRREKNKSRRWRNIIAENKKGGKYNHKQKESKNGRVEIRRKKVKKETTGEREERGNEKGQIEVADSRR